MACKIIKFLFVFAPILITFRRSYKHVKDSSKRLEYVTYPLERLFGKFNLRIERFDFATRISDKDSKLDTPPEVKLSHKFAYRS